MLGLKLFGNPLLREEERTAERDRLRNSIDNPNDRAQWEMSHLIGYTTSTSVEDWSIVMEIYDRVNLSDPEAKEASKALRKDIQWDCQCLMFAGRSLIRKRLDSDVPPYNSMGYLDAKLQPILCWAYDEPQVPGKIEEIALSPATSPVVRDRLVEVIGTSVYLLRESKNLKPYQATWKKLILRLNLSHPVEGVQIPADDPILNPGPPGPAPSLRRPSPNGPIQHRIYSNAELEPAHPVERRSALNGEREQRRDRNLDTRPNYSAVSPEEDVRQLFEECEIARDNCRILADSLVYATPDSIATDTVIKEFREKCMKSQEIIGAQFGWVTAIADRARLEQVAKNGSEDTNPTTEERLLQALVMVHGELNDVFKTYDDLERIAISEREEAEVRARSKVELRLDRSLDEDDHTIPSDNQGASLSQTHTPTPAHGQFPPPGHTRRPLPQLPQTSPYVNSLSPPPPTPYIPQAPSQNRTPPPKLGSLIKNDHNEGTIAQSAGISHATYERSLASQDTMGSEISVNTMEPQNDGSAPAFDFHEILISRTMDVREVVSHLVAHGCQDLSARLDESSFGEYPVAHGGFSDIYHGRLLDSTRVAVKALRVSVDSITKEPKHFKHAARELYAWSQCNHPNVIPLLGLAIFRNRIGMLSPWMGQGNLPRYLQTVPDADRLHMCIQICEALSYLHQIRIIHCDLKGANVLVSEEGTPFLTDFGTSLLVDRTLGFTQTTSGPAFPYDGPEILDETSPHTEMSDVYALGMNIGNNLRENPIPGKGRLERDTSSNCEAELPERPECMRGGENEDSLWNLLVRCWSFEPTARPSAAEVTAIMKTISGASSRLEANGKIE
ncbi:GAT domain [Rhizoctonia solani]|uniref:GAT domain n=1 Tax=Rhizoctonia solani TaxID=456999 RepID=A0A8H7IBE0_9AGAM|nr:GAT domain [Rhizoctonia solani]